MSEERLKLKVAGNLILVRNDEVLLSLRKNTGFSDGDYSVVGGHLEIGETVKQTVIREAKEEIGILIKEKDLKFTLVLHNWETSERRIQFFFTTTVWQGEIVNEEPNQSGGLKWFAFDSLPDNIVPHIKKALEQFKKGVQYFEWP